MATLIGSLNCNQTLWVTSDGILWRVDNDTPWEAKPNEDGEEDGDGLKSSPFLFFRNSKRILNTMRLWALQS
jgi:hypothetical protein